jgi:hypothetical protein
MVSLRKTLESGATSTKSLETTPMNVARNIHWFPISNKTNQNLDWNLIQRIINGNKSSMQNPFLP